MKDAGSNFLREHFCAACRLAAKLTPGYAVVVMDQQSWLGGCVAKQLEVDEDGAQAARVVASHSELERIYANPFVRCLSKNDGLLGIMEPPAPTGTRLALFVSNVGTEVAQVVLLGDGDPYEPA